MTISIGHYLKNLAKLTDNFKPNNYSDERTQRLYLKDIDCPEPWFSYLSGVLPPQVLYLNESTGTVGGPGSATGPDGPFGSVSRGLGVAPAGDLMSSLPPPMRAENLMCYIGHEGTYTPAHREMCATLGQNIMVETSGTGLDPWGKQEKPGSSLWLMTETKDRHLVVEYWMSILGHDIEVESHFAQINAWKNAPFKTYVVEQRVGDFILIPPLAPHQVWNRGTRTMKVAWNRTTVETLEMALEEALPRARMVCRDEQYKCKAIVYFSLIKYSALLDHLDSQKAGLGKAALAEIDTDRKVRSLRRDFRHLFRLYQQIILSEMFSPDLPKQKNVQFLPYDSNVTCAYCRCNIFNRFLTCPTCINELENGDEDAYDVCMECYAMGRSCACISNLKWVEQFHWKDLVDKYDEWRFQIIDMDGFVTQSSPLTLDEARIKLGKKTLAAVCQEQLKIRPWRDITKPAPTRVEEQGREEDDPNEEIDVDDNGRKKTKKKKRSRKWNRDHVNCHICKHREVSWKLARCSCGTAYCYGVLFRAFDLMPLDIMENPNWKCPRCLGICSCGQCRREGGTTPYEPHGTLVGHDTKRVADPRSVESLVDFSRSNLNWINKLGGDVADDVYETVRLRRFKEEADREKAKDDDLGEGDPDQEDHILPDADSTYQTMMPVAPRELERTGHGGIQLDPALMSRMSVPVMTSAPDSGSARMRSEDNQRASGNLRLRLRSHSSSVANDDQRRPALPPPSAMLGGAPSVEQGPSQDLQTPHIAHAGPGSSGFDDDEEMIELERNPNGFIANAGLTGLRHDVHMGYQPRQYVAPTANMTRTIIRDHGAPSEPNPWTETSSNQGPSSGLRSTAIGETAAQRRKRQKRKRDGEDYRTEIDMVAAGMRSANREYEQARVQKMLADAKKNDNFTMTQARLKHQQKIIKLPVQHSQLSHMQDDQEEDVETDVPQHIRSQVRGKRARRSALGGDGAGDEMDGDISIVHSDFLRDVGVTQSSTVVENQEYEAPPNIFGRKKRGRPRKSEVTERAIQSSASAKQTSGVEQATPNGRNQEPRAMSSADITNDSGPSTRSRSRKDMLFPNDQQHTIGQASPTKAIKTNQRNLRSSLSKNTSLLENDNKNADDSPFDEVDDNYLPISNKTNATNSSSMNMNDKYSYNLNGKLSSATGSSDNHAKEHGNPYHDAKLMALRIAEGEVSNLDESEERSLEEEDHDGMYPTISVAVKKIHRTTNTPKGDQEKRMLTKATLMQVEGSPKAGSLLSRPGMVGKKIKIVSQKNSVAARRQTTGDADGSL